MKSMRSCEVLIFYLRKKLATLTKFPALDIRAKSLALWAALECERFMG